MSKIGRALIRAAAARLTARVISSIIGIVLIPFVLGKLGYRLYGAWVLVGTVTGYYGLLDLGLSSAVSRFVSREIGRGNKAGANRYIAASFYLFSLSGIIIFLLAALAAIFCGRFVKDPNEVVMFRYLLLITGFTLGIRFPARCFHGTLAAHLRFDLVSTVSIIFTILRAGLIVAVLLYGYKLVAMALVTAFTSLVRLGTVIVIVRWIHGPISFRPSLVKWKIIRTLFGYASFTFAARIADLLQRRTIPFIITGFLGLELVAPYDIASKLRKVILKTCRAIVATMRPVFSQMEGRGEEGSIQWSYFFSYKISCYLSTFLVGMMAICGADFVGRWLGHQLTASGCSEVVMLVYIGLIATFSVAVQIPTVDLLFGTSRNKFYAISSWIQAIFIFALVLILIRPLGLVGVILAVSIMSFIVKMFIQAWWACRFLEISLLRYHFHHTLPNVLKPAVYLVAVFFVARWYIVEPTYFRVFLVSGGAGILFVPYIFFAGFDRKERGKFLEAVGLARTKTL